MGVNPPYEFIFVECMGEELLSIVKDSRSRCRQLNWFGDCGVTQGTHDLWNALNNILKSHRIYS